jgi:hypothetical protein
MGGGCFVIFVAVSAALSAPAFMRALAAQLDGIDESAISLTTFKLTVTASARLPCPALGFNGTIKAQFEAAVLASTAASGAVSTVAVGDVAGCDGGLQAVASVPYSVVTTDPTAADALAVLMANATSLVLALTAALNMVGLSVAAGEVVLASQPEMATEIEYSVTVPSAMRVDGVKAAAMQTGNIVAAAQVAADAVPITQDPITASSVMAVREVSSDAGDGVLEAVDSSGRASSRVAVVTALLLVVTMCLGLCFMCCRKRRRQAKAACKPYPLQDADGRSINP